MKFWEALKALQETGIGIYRESWEGNGNRAEHGIAKFVDIRLPDQVEDPAMRMSFPFLFLTVNTSKMSGKFTGTIPWTPSQGDLLSEDWATV